MSENRRVDFLTHTVQRDKNVNFSLSLVAQQVRPYMQVYGKPVNGGPKFSYHVYP